MVSLLSLLLGNIGDLFDNHRIWIKVRSVFSNYKILKLISLLVEMLILKTVKMLQNNNEQLQNKRTWHSFAESLSYLYHVGNKPDILFKYYWRITRLFWFVFIFFLIYVLKNKLYSSDFRPYQLSSNWSNFGLSISTNKSDKFNLSIQIQLQSISL